jgi:hypothetical protein
LPVFGFLFALPTRALPEQQAKILGDFSANMGAKNFYRQLKINLAALAEAL